MPSRRALALPLLLAALVCSVAVAGPPVRSGFYLEEELINSSSGSAPTRELSRTWMAPGRLRKERGSVVTISRSDDPAVWVLDTARRSWFEVRPESLREMGEMGASLVLAPREGEPGSGLERTGRERRVGSWDAYEVRMEDRPLKGARISIWLSRDVPIGPELRNQFADQMFGQKSPLEDLLRSLRDLEGYPVEISVTLQVGNQIFDVRQTLKKVEMLEIPESEFAIPDGYTKTRSPFEPEPGAGDRRARPGGDARPAP